MNREAVLSIALSGMIITVAVFGGLYYETLTQRDEANRRLQQTNVCIGTFETDLANLAIHSSNSTSFRELAIGVYLDFGNCLAKIQ